VLLADLDIVNPYFRAKDSAGELAAAGIELISSDYANSNVDFPALPSELYRIVDDTDYRAVVDIGGDDRGALALGRFADRTAEENDYDMLMVINERRPLTSDAAGTLEVAREIEAAGHLKFTGIINNTNLGEQTDAQVLLDSVSYAEETAKSLGVPVVMTTVMRPLYDELKGKIPDLFPIDLQKREFF
ncbi:MAG: hypothetical protein IJT91_02730, partial [Clostridia bacterium]|nr:hypothetical protein [Clostridia bacterium]